MVLRETAETSHPEGTMHQWQEEVLLSMDITIFRKKVGFTFFLKANVGLALYL